MPSLKTRIVEGWNAFFRGRDHPYEETRYVTATVSSGRMDRTYRSLSSEKTIVSTIYSRISVDVSSCDIRHIITNDNGQYKEDAESDLNKCFNLSPNLDQTNKALFQDLVFSMLDEGYIALLPVYADVNADTDEYEDIQNLRVAQIVEWGPESVKLRAYNEKTGQKEEIYAKKSMVAIIQNPFYETMNAPNSTTKRLMNKMTMLDVADAQTYSGKMNIIIQLPYSTRNPKRKEDAIKRTEELETQIRDSKYGIGYSDVSEKIIQLNRAVESNLYQQVKDLKQELYNQLGLTQAIFDGTADEQTQLNYYDRTIAPILDAICLECKRKFLSENARKERHESIAYFRKPFRIVPIEKLAEIVDKLTRNAVVSSNEMRSELGYKPVDDPRADELRNKNLNASEEELSDPITTDGGNEENK